MPLRSVRRARGKDFSSYQRPVTDSDLQGLDFAATRVSNWQPDGSMGVDPNFAHNWAIFLRHGLVRKAYWYMLPDRDPVQQARFFAEAVKQQGLGPGDVLVCDSEVLTANVDEVTHAFCVEVGRLAGPGVITEVYTDQNVGRSLVSCTRWALWLAWPSPYPPGPAECAPWPDWTFWQSGVVRGVDVDQFNGDIAALRSWADGPPVTEDDPMFIDLSKPDAQAHVPVWPLAGAAGLPIPWQNATLVLGGQNGAVVKAYVHYQDGHTEAETYTLAAGRQTLVKPGSLKDVATVHLQRDDQAQPGKNYPAASAVLNRW